MAKEMILTIDGRSEPICLRGDGVGFRNDTKYPGMMVFYSNEDDVSKTIYVMTDRLQTMEINEDRK